MQNPKFQLSTLHLQKSTGQVPVAVHVTVHICIKLLFEMTTPMNNKDWTLCEF